MQHLKVRVLRTVATAAALGIISLVGGIAPASAGVSQDCQANYAAYGYTSASECIIGLNNGHHIKHR